MKKVLFFCLVALLCASCTKFYEKSVKVDDSGWAVDSLARFEFDIQDTSATYNIGILVRNSPKYDYQNLWLFMKKVNPDMEYHNDTIQLFLADDMGNWNGKGIGSICSATYSYQDSVKFTQPGKYMYIIQHGMRTDSLSGIYNIGLIIEKNGEE